MKKKGNLFHFPSYLYLFQIFNIFDIYIFFNYFLPHPLLSLSHPYQPSLLRSLSQVYDFWFCFVTNLVQLGPSVAPLDRTRSLGTDEVINGYTNKATIALLSRPIRCKLLVEGWMP